MKDSLIGIMIRYGIGLTLTLSQAVRDAIQQDHEIVSIITGKGWTISPAPIV